MRVIAKPALALLACLAALTCPAAALAAAPAATPATVAWVRSAASRFVTAELARDGSSACAVLLAPLRSTRNGRTCEQRWDARTAAMLRAPGERASLREQLREISRAHVSLNGGVASIALSTPLLQGSSRLVWNEMCWMVSN